MLTNRKYSGRRPLVVVAALLSLMILLPLAGCKTEVDTSSGSPQQETTYTVKFVTERGGDAPLPITVKSGATLAEADLKPLTEVGWTFLGWYDGETKAEGGKYTVTKDVTLEAQWEFNTGSIEVTFPNSTGTAAKLTYTEAGGVYTFSPDFGQEYNSYRWLVNGEEQDGSSGATFQLAVGDLSAGRYEIRVEVVDSGVINDARVIVEVKK